MRLNLKFASLSAAAGPKLSQLDHFMKSGSIQQLHVPPTGKCSRFLRESARRHNETTSSPARSHDAIKLTDNVHADAERLPLLALNQKLLAALAKHQVNATIRAAVTVFRA